MTGWVDLHTGEAFRTEPLPVLPRRQMQVLRAIAEGCSNASIARDLGVSVDTVSTHVRHLYRRLGARNREHAVAEGFRQGLLS